MRVMGTIQQEWQLQRRGSAPSYVLLALSRESTYPLIGEKHQLMLRESTVYGLTHPERLSSLCSWLFCLFLGADTNMRMVRKKVSSKDADPTLSPGWSFFVETTKYKEHLANYQEQKETVSCYLLRLSVTCNQVS